MTKRTSRSSDSSEGSEPAEKRIRVSGSPDVSTGSPTTSPAPETTRLEEFTALRNYLPPSASVTNIFKVLEVEIEDALIIQPISREKVEELFRRRDRSGLPWKFSYLHQISRFIITKSTKLHKVAFAGLEVHINYSIFKARLGFDWKLTECPAIRKGHSICQGDSLGRPFPERGWNDWPTLVIEFSCSQSWSEMYTKMRWWFEASGGDVKIVLFAKISREERLLRIEQWTQTGPPPPPTSKAMTRAVSALAFQPTLRQTIDFKIPDAGHSAGPNVFTMEGGPLRLNFKELFLRDPEGGQGDIILSKDTLQNWAGHVWSSFDQTFGNGLQ